jgi:hypothetical protein
MLRGSFIDCLIQQNVWDNINASVYDSRKESRQFVQDWPKDEKTRKTVNTAWLTYEDDQLQRS